MRTILLELDDADYDAVQEAVARRQSLGREFGITWPDPVSDSRELGEQREPWNEPDPLADGSNIAGLAVAEICRDWMEFMDFSEQEPK